MAAPIAKLYALAVVVVTLVICGHTKSARAEGWMHPSIPQMEVDALRTEYIALERALWDYLAKTANSQNNKETQIRKVYDSHRDFDSKPLMGRPFEEHRYEILNHYEWSFGQEGTDLDDALGGLVVAQIRATRHQGGQEGEESLQHRGLLCLLGLFQGCRLQPLSHVEQLDGVLQEEVLRQVGGTDLQEEQIHVGHRVAEVRLDVGHRLTLDLQPVAHPFSGQDLVEETLKRAGEYIFILTYIYHNKLN